MLSHDEMMNATLDKLERRAMFKKAGTGVVGMIAAAAVARTALAPTPAEAAVSINSGSPTALIPGATSAPTALDAAILNFALNLEYLEANYYSYSLLGQTLSANDLAGGVGMLSNGSYTFPTAGVQPTTTGAQKVPFATPVIAQLAQTIAADEIAHVRFIKNSLASLGAAAVPCPAIDISAPGAFSTLAAAGNLYPGQSPAMLNPYLNENAFLTGAYIFEDVGVTAYGGASGLLSQGSQLIQYAASILAMEAYHAGTIRTILSIRNGGATTDAISNLRSTLSTGVGETTTGSDDFGTLDPASGFVVLAPRDANALAFRRTTSQVLNIVYGNQNTVAPTGNAAGSSTPGLFFPSGMNSNYPNSNGLFK